MTRAVIEVCVYGLVTGECYVRHDCLDSRCCSAAWVVSISCNISVCSV